MSYHASAATVGNSRGLRLDAALFKAHPEFAKGEYEVDVIAPGRLLVRVEVPNRVEADPVFETFLSFIEREMVADPEHITPLTIAQAREAAAVVGDMDVDLEGDLGDDYEMP